MRWWHVIAFVLAIALPASGADRTVGFTVSVDHPLLAWAIGRDLGVADGRQAVLWGAPDDCHSLIVDRVEVGAGENDELDVQVHGAARVGFGILGLCIVPFRWHGYVAIDGHPVVGDDWQLRLTNTRTRLLDEDHAPTTVGTRLLELVRDYVVGPVDQFHLDLTPPAAETRALLRASVAGPRAAPVVDALATLRPAGVAVDAAATTVSLVMDVRLPPHDAAAVPPVDDTADAAATEAALERWDAFLTFVVKDVATLGDDLSIRDDLLAVLLGDRHTLLDALRTPPSPGVDPVRRLFLEAWSELRGIARRAITTTHAHDRALRYVSFLAAGDALAALEGLGAEAGVTISAEGLRRLARLVSPDALGDPLVYSDRPDPGLQTLFGIHEPAATPPPTEPERAPEPESWWRRLGPAPAIAAEPAPDLGFIGRRLDRWVPRREELDVYRSLVDQLLGTIADRTGASLDPRLSGLYPQLVRTTAWQESCWRQFVPGDRGRVTFLASGSGDVGMMQVNRRVWRGFFDLEKLKWDVVYNVGAGAEILVRLLERVGAREASEQVDNAARATYSAYNGGPAAYRRYRTPHVPRELRRIDDLFWEKWRRMSSGPVGDAVLCL